MSEEEKVSFLKRLFKHNQNENVRETIEDLIEEAKENGDDNFNEHEQLLLNNVLDLRDRKCENIMIPRAEIVAFPKSGKVFDLANLMIEKGHSRIPIYGESLDDIVGIVHVIDLVKGVLNHQMDLNIDDVISDKIKFVSPEKKVPDLLKEMQQEKTHIAMVVDDYGGVDGLVTIEDLLEEIVGDIEDEYDKDEESNIVVQKNGNIAVDGKAEIEEIMEVCGIDLYQGLSEEDKDEIDTLNGLILHFIKRVPKRGDVINGLNGYKFRIVDADYCQVKKAVVIVPAKIS